MLRRFGQRAEVLTTQLPARQLRQPQSFGHSRRNAGLAGDAVSVGLEGEEKKLVRFTAS